MLPPSFVSKNGGTKSSLTGIKIDTVTDDDDDNAIMSVCTATTNSSSTNNNQVNDHGNGNSFQQQQQQHAAELFPYLLHGMLEDVEKVGQASIVSWTVDGKSFRIHDTEQFVLSFLGRYFSGFINTTTTSSSSSSSIGANNGNNQFRSILTDWGFDNPNLMDREIFFHPCFQKSDPSLCHYMRCGKTIKNNKAEDNNSNRKEESTSTSKTGTTHTVVPVVNNTNNRQQQQQQAQVMDIRPLMKAAPVSTATVTAATINSTATNTNVNVNTNNTNSAMTFGNAAIQMLLEQHQLQQQQSVALQVQALLNNSNLASNPAVAALLLNQIIVGQQQQQQQQQFSPEIIAAVAQSLQIQQQQQPIAAANNVNVNVNSSPQQNPPPSTTVSLTACIPSTSTNKPSVLMHQCVPQWINNNINKTTPQVKRMTPVKKTTKKKAVATAATTGTAVTAKRAAFLNKRTKATGAAYRNPNKKQKTGPSSGDGGKRRKKAVTTKSLSSSLVTSNKIKNGGGPTGASFILNEDFKEPAIVSIDLLFPWKLHDMLDGTEQNEDLKKNVISWQPDGVSFAIHDKERFVKEVIPQYFEKSTFVELDSFLKVLLSWGFIQFTSGAQKGSFIHRLLVKGKRSICKQMRINGKTVSDWMKRHGQFLGRLHALLCHSEKKGQRSIVSWTPDGKKFRIHDPSAFMNSVFPLYFDSLTYSSFEQKLRRWGFMRSPANHQKIDKETKLENATYSHPCFLKDKVPTLMWIKSDTSIPRTLRPLHNFLYRLRVMLSDSSRHGHQFVISWSPHGKAFMIHDRPHFSNSIMPHYFKSKFTSFRQSLRNHGFAQIGGNSWDEGAYYHKLFLRDEPLLCQGLTQDQMKKAMPEWIPVEDEPSFYPKDNHESVVAAAAMVSLKSSSPTNAL